MKLSQVIAPAIELHNSLNPKIWTGQHLRPEVQTALLKISRSFQQYVDIPFDIEDIIVTGSNANYTYTKHSDLDLHLIVDFKQVECARQTEELFDTKRLLFKREHSITIRDIPVEIYVENIDEPVKGAVYSLSKNSWITPPEQQDQPDVDFAAVERMTRIWGRLIQRAVIHAHLPTCERLMELLRNYRRIGLNTPDREFSKGNLVYKSLRNSGSVEALAVMLDRLHDQKLSISQ